ncbi:isoprenylcysteine carboxylmethyltransferase family protein, partial [Mariprofundus erugo]
GHAVGDAGAAMKRLQLKIPPPLVALLFGGIIWQLQLLLPVYADAVLLRHSAAMVLLVLALIIDLMAIISFRRAGTTIDPRYPHKSATVVTGGIYACSRNPMYTSLVLLLLSLTLWLGTPFGLIAIAAFILYMYHFQITAEEEMLTSRFGNDYLAYKARVRRWL